MSDSCNLRILNSNGPILDSMDTHVISVRIQNRNTQNNVLILTLEQILVNGRI